MRRVAARAGIVLGLLLGCLVLGTTPASAHAEVVSTWPAEGERSDVAVDRVVLTFATPVVPGLTAMVVTDASGKPLPGGPRVVGSVVTFDLDPLREAGRYDVEYRTVAADGHPLADDLGFSVSEAGARAARSGRVAGSVASTSGGDARMAGHATWDRTTGLVSGAALVALMGLAVLRRQRESQAGA